MLVFYHSVTATLCIGHKQDYTLQVTHKTSILLSLLVHSLLSSKVTLWLCRLHNLIPAAKEVQASELTRSYKVKKSRVTNLYSEWAHDTDEVHTC